MLLPLAYSSNGFYLRDVLTDEGKNMQTIPTLFHQLWVGNQQESYQTAPHHIQHLVMKGASDKLLVDSIGRKLQETKGSDALNIILEKRALDCLD